MLPHFRGQTGTLGGWNSDDEHDGAYSVSLNNLETDSQLGPKDGNTLRRHLSYLLQLITTILTLKLIP